MKKHAIKFTFTFTAAFLTNACAALAEDEPYSTQITITGKESGPYSVTANVTSTKRPYKMDRSRDITNEDLSRVLAPILPDQSGGFPISGKDLKNAFDSMDEKLEKQKAISQPQEQLEPHAHPSDTEMISDPVPEAVPINDDEHYRQIDMAIARARKDLIEAEDRLAKSTAEHDRQQAIKDIAGARQRLQEATNAAP